MIESQGTAFRSTPILKRFRGNVEHLRDFLGREVDFESLGGIRFAHLALQG